jgi:CSLREA domain-containing protein
MRSITRHWLLGLGLAGAAIALSGCDVTPELGLTVTTTTDGADAAPGDGICESTTGVGDCSMRAAIQEANAFTASDAGHTTITLADATYALTIAGTEEDAAATGDLDITGDLTIRGSGAIIDANGLDRVIDVRTGSTVDLDLTTITDGTATHGGGIRAFGGTLTIRRTTISANTANGYTTCTFPRFGSPVCDANEGGGGGVWAANAVVNVVDSTISDNSTTGNGPCVSVPIASTQCFLHGGGGILALSPVNLIDVTISGNQASDAYGAGMMTANGATVLHSTIAGNTVTGPPAAFYGDPGNGHALAGSMTLGASAIAGEGPLCSASASGLLPSSLGHNLSEDATCLAGVSDATDQIGVAAGLSALGDHGGPTRTHLPGPNLVDTIPAGGFCGPLPDQRGTARPQGSACDIGAVERTPVDPLIRYARCRSTTTGQWSLGSRPPGCDRSTRAATTSHAELTKT